jgi:hypothetical protein
LARLNDLNEWRRAGLASPARSPAGVLDERGPAVTWVVLALFVTRLVPRASVVPLGKVRAGGWTMREVYADPATNEGSAFSGHLVLVWSAGGHTYALGFHLNGSRHETRMLNATVARSVSLVPP